MPLMFLYKEIKYTHSIISTQRYISEEIAATKHVRDMWISEYKFHRNTKLKILKYKLVRYYI